MEKRGRIDGHMHVAHQNPEALFEVAAHYGFDRFATLGCPCLWKLSNNMDCLLPKVMAPKKVYAFGGLSYGPRQDTKEALADQLRRMMDAGLDGLKLIETKPAAMRRLNVRLDSELYEGVFALAEEHGFPVLWHVGDPATFWSIETAPAFAIAGNMCYIGEEWPPLSEIYAQVEKVLTRHPKLRVCFAHFYFTGDDMAHAARMFDTWPNVWFDLTPGTEMYSHFLRDTEKWRAFFEKYSRRIFMGTDFTDSQADMENGLFDHLYTLATEALEKSGPVKVWDIEGTGMGLSAEALNNIYVSSYEAFAGREPIPMNKEGLERLRNWYQAQYDGLNDNEDRGYCMGLLDRIIGTL